MSIAADINTRQERKTQLLQMWRTKNGQSTVLSMCHQALAPGESLKAGMSVIDVVLDHEFGKESAESAPDGNLDDDGSE